MNRSASILCVLALLAFSGCSGGGSGIVEIGNDRASLGFERLTGRLVSFLDKDNDYEFIDPSAVEGLPWKVDPADPDSFSQDGEYKVTFRKRGRSRVDIRWKYKGDVPLVVRMTVSLEENRPMAHWRASFSGLKAKYRLHPSQEHAAGLQPA